MSERELLNTYEKSELIGVLRETKSLPEDEFRYMVSETRSIHSTTHVLHKHGNMDQEAGRITRLNDVLMLINSFDDDTDMYVEGTGTEASNISPGAVVLFIQTALEQNYKRPHEVSARVIAEGLSDEQLRAIGHIGFNNVQLITPDTEVAEPNVPVLANTAVPQDAGIAKVA